MGSKAGKAGKPEASEARLARGRTRSEAIFPVAPPVSSLPASYGITLQEIQGHLRQARVRAVHAANPIVIEAYWQTGKIILARQEEAAWGAKVIDRLAADLGEAFPDMSGLSARNLLAMKVFAREFPDGPIAQQPVAQLPWGHVLQIIQRIKDPTARDYYIRESLVRGWSRSMLELNISCMVANHSYDMRAWQHACPVNLVSIFRCPVRHYERIGANSDHFGITANATTKRHYAECTVIVECSARTSTATCSDRSSRYAYANSSSINTASFVASRAA